MSVILQVPPELKDDLLLIADKIEPYLLEVKEQAKKIPEKAHELAQKIEPAAEQLGEKIEQGAAKVQPLLTVQQLQCLALDNAMHKTFFAFFRKQVSCFLDSCKRYADSASSNMQLRDLFIIAALACANFVYVLYTLYLYATVSLVSTGHPFRRPWTPSTCKQPRPLTSLSPWLTKLTDNAKHTADKLCCPCR